MSMPRPVRIRVAVLLTLAVLTAGGWLVWQHPWVKKRVRAARHPAGIVIHHTCTPPRMQGHLVGVADIDRMHAHRGFGVYDRRTRTTYHIGYHFLIRQDGTVLPGRPAYLLGAHARGNPKTLGIALIGNFDSRSNHGQAGPLTPPPAQLAAAIRLTRQLMARYRLTADDVYLHRALVPTACPGNHFPATRFSQGIRTATTTGPGLRGPGPVASSRFFNGITWPWLSPRAGDSTPSSPDYPTR